MNNNSSLINIEFNNFVESQREILILYGEDGIGKTMNIRYISSIIQRRVKKYMMNGYDR